MLNLCRIPLLLCLGSYIILSRNIDAMQLMKSFPKCEVTTQDCAHGCRRLGWMSILLTAVSMAIFT